MRSHCSAGLASSRPAATSSPAEGWTSRFPAAEQFGSARAGYIGVMVPIVALVISAAFEGFQWALLTWAGVAISVAGNVIILRRT